MADNVWLRPRRARRPAPTLSRDRIVEEAVSLLDDEGIERLTMRRLAERLDAGSTTLYWYIQTKDDVLDLAVDAVFAEVTMPQVDERDWRGAVTNLLKEWRRALLDHPWSVSLLGRPPLGPHALRRSEFLHTTLAEAGFEEASLASAAYGLSNYVIGSVAAQATWQLRGGDTLRKAANKYISSQADRYPTLAAHFEMLGDDWDGSFERGLTYLLDGLEVHLDRE